MPQLTAHFLRVAWWPPAGRAPRKRSASAQQREFSIASRASASVYRGPERDTNTCSHLARTEEEELGSLDSNQNQKLQRLLCCHYTTPHRRVPTRFRLYRPSPLPAAHRREEHARVGGRLQVGLETEHPHRQAGLVREAHRRHEDVLAAPLLVRQREYLG